MQKYITYEIIRKIDDIKWAGIRKLELELEKLKEGKKISTEEVVEKATGSALTSEKIYYLIKNNDTGEGVDVETLLKKLNISDTGACDQILKNLLEQGEIFDVKPGRYKVLE